MGALTFLPMLALAPIPTTTRHAVARAIVKYWFALFVSMMRSLGVIRINIGDISSLAEAQGKLVVANHPSLIDVVLLIAIMPPTNCVVKSTLFVNPFTAMIVRVAGYIRNDRPEAMIQQCADSLERNETLIVFPEGTRTVPGKPIKMQRGTAHILWKTRADFVPVVVQCKPTVLAKTMHWYDVPETTPLFSIESLPVVSSEEILQPNSERSLAVRAITSWLEDFFQRRLEPTQ